MRITGTYLHNPCHIDPMLTTIPRQQESTSTFSQLPAGTRARLSVLHDQRPRLARAEARRIVHLFARALDAIDSTTHNIGARKYKYLIVRRRVGRRRVGHQGKLM